MVRIRLLGVLRSDSNSPKTDVSIDGNFYAMVEGRYGNGKSLVLQESTQGPISGKMSICHQP